jgi:hypothetical protein
MTGETHGEKEYRISGCSDEQWRATAWGDRETAIDDYQTADGNWELLAIERRSPGNNRTLERAPAPESDEWQPVTEEMTHIQGEEVARSDS